MGRFLMFFKEHRLKIKKTMNISKNLGNLTNKGNIHLSREEKDNEEEEEQYELEEEEEDEELLGKQRRVLEVLREGGFGQVLKCCNLETGIMEAVKVMKSRTGVIEMAKHEIPILKQLQHLDPHTRHLVRFNSSFFNMEDICLSFEFLDVDLQGRTNQGRHITEQLYFHLGPDPQHATVAGKNSPLTGRNLEQCSES